MTTKTPREEPDPGLGATLFSIFQPNSNRLRPDILIDEVNAGLLDTCATVQNTVRYVHAAPGPESPSSESGDLYMQRGHCHRSETIDREPEAIPQESLHNHGSPFVTDADDPEVAGQPVGQGHSSISAPTTLNFCVRMWGALLNFFVLFLVVIPGLVLGVVIRQLPWGITLCGLIATVISFFASFYYHLDK